MYRLSARVLSRDMEQNSEDAWGTKRSAEIHSGVQPELAQRKPPGKRSCFAEYLLEQIINSTHPVISTVLQYMYKW